ncbi:MAG TPA: hypothetical protein VNR90_05045 [Vicinamibacterales bacterium]|jgi:hypothetical protein|nr:hypothetical protein [Vicinamibacterales bacterium]
MRVVVLALLAVLTGRLAAPAAAAAQYHQVTDAIVVGGALGSAGSGAQRVTGGPEIGGLIEVPMGDALRVRGEAALGMWHFGANPYFGIAGIAMRRHRLTVSVLRSRFPPSPARRLAPYAGGGAGIYLYRFSSGPNGGAWGIHGVAGVEYLLRTMRSRWIAGGEVQLHAMAQPKAAGDVTWTPMIGTHVAIVLKYRLP